MGEADEEKRRRCRDRGIDTVLDRRENGDQNGSKPDDEFKRGDAPEGVDLMQNC